MPRVSYLSLGRASFFQALRISSSKKEKPNVYEIEKVYKTTSSLPSEFVGRVHVLEKGSRPVFPLSVGNKKNNIVSIHQTAHKFLYDESFTE